MTTQATEFKPVSFCQSLFAGANVAAKKRWGQEPFANQLQMADLVAAFRDMRRHDYTEHFGLIVGEWNESMAIIKTYLAAADPKTPKALHPELGQSLGGIIEQWGHFEELPKEVKAKIRKAKKQFLEQEDALLERTVHFFNETKVRASSLPSAEKEGVNSLVALYQPQVRDECHKRDVSGVFRILDQFKGDIERLAKQAKEPSRTLDTLVTKTRRDLKELEAFGNKGKRGRK